MNSKLVRMFIVSKRNVRIVLSVIFVLFEQCLFAQQVAVGGSLLYNPQTESVGLGLRTEIPYKKISFVPQLTYYPFFNKITEYYLAVATHLDVMGTAKWKVYVIGMLGYDRCINS